MIARFLLRVPVLGRVLRALAEARDPEWPLAGRPDDPFGRAQDEGSDDAIRRAKEETQP